MPTLGIGVVSCRAASGEFSAKGGNTSSPEARSREASSDGSGPVLHNGVGATDKVVSWCPPHHLMSVGVEPIFVHVPSPDKRQIRTIRLRKSQLRQIATWHQRSDGIPN